MRRRWRNILIALAVPAALALAAAAYETREQWREKKDSAAPSPPREIVVRGRLEPAEGVFEVAAFSIAPTTAVGEILVSEGQTVRRGELVATLRSHAQALASVDSAKAALAVAERRLDLTRRPYKDSTVLAQQAAVQARQAELNLAEAQMHRTDKLQGRGIISDETRDLRLAESTRARANLEEARARLKATVEVPETEILLGEAEVTAARSRLLAAQEELRLAEIRAPVDGVVLKVRAKSGELVSHRQIMDIGNVARPKIVAEVDERLVARLRVGQAVRASLRGEDREWPGKIARIGGVVVAQRRPSIDTVTDRGGRIVEVDADIADPTGLPPIAGLELLVRIDAP